MIDKILLFSTAMAQEAAKGAASPKPSILETLALPAGLLLIFYFLLIRPQSKKAKDHAALISGLKVGDEVITSGGIIGKIKSVTDTFVTVDISPNANIKVLKSHVSGLTKQKEGAKKVNS